LTSEYRFTALAAGRREGVLESFVDENVRWLSEDKALTAALKWYRVVDDDFTVPARRIAAAMIYLRDGVAERLGRDVAK
jgi:hypothetical protein